MARVLQTKRAQPRRTKVAVAPGDGEPEVKAITRQMNYTADDKVRRMNWNGNPDMRTTLHILRTRFDRTARMDAAIFNRIFAKKLAANGFVDGMSPRILRDQYSLHRHWSHKNPIWPKITNPKQSAKEMAKRRDIERQIHQIKAEINNTSVDRDEDEDRGSDDEAGGHRTMHVDEDEEGEASDAEDDLEAEYRNPTPPRPKVAIGHSTKKGSQSQRPPRHSQQGKVKMNWKDHPEMRSFLHVLRTECAELTREEEAEIFSEVFRPILAAAGYTDGMPPQLLGDQYDQRTKPGRSEKTWARITDPNQSDEELKRREKMVERIGELAEKIEIRKMKSVQWDGDADDSDKESAGEDGAGPENEEQDEDGRGNPSEDYVSEDDAEGEEVETTIAQQLPSQTTTTHQSVNDFDFNMNDAPPEAAEYDHWMDGLDWGLDANDNYSDTFGHDIHGNHLPTQNSFDQPQLGQSTIDQITLLPAAHYATTGAPAAGFYQVHSDPADKYPSTINLNDVYQITGNPATSYQVPKYSTAGNLAAPHQATTNSTPIYPNSFDSPGFIDWNPFDWGAASQPAVDNSAAGQAPFHYGTYGRLPFDHGTFGQHVWNERGMGQPHFNQGTFTQPYLHQTTMNQTLFNYDGAGDYPFSNHGAIHQASSNYGGGNQAGFNYGAPNQATSNYGAVNQSAFSPAAVMVNQTTSSKNAAGRSMTGVSMVRSRTLDGEAFRRSVLGQGTYGQNNDYEMEDSDAAVDPGDHIRYAPPPSPTPATDPRLRGRTAPSTAAKAPEDLPAPQKSGYIIRKMIQPPLDPNQRKEGSRNDPLYSTDFINDRQRLIWHQRGRAWGVGLPPKALLGQKTEDQLHHMHIRIPPNLVIRPGSDKYIHKKKDRFYWTITAENIGKVFPDVDNIEVRMRVAEDHTA